MIFLEYYPNFINQIYLEKQNEIIRKRKKSISHSQESLKEDFDKNRQETLGGEITDVVLAKDGTVRTFIKGYKEPVKSYSDHIAVNSTVALKRIMPLILGNLSNMGWGKRIITLLALRYNLNLFYSWLDRYFEMFEILLEEKYWCQPVKEIRRVLKGQINNRMIDFLSMILEYDSAYKNRFQDVFPLLDKSQLKGLRAVKEVKRLFGILAERDYAENAAKWRQMEKFAGLAMYIPKIRNKVISILKEVKLEEIAFSKEDLYWVRMFPSYEYLGIPLEERKKENIKLYDGIK